MTNYAVAGSISGQAAAGETVTITVTAPDGTTSTPVNQPVTLADLSYSVSWADSNTMQTGTYTGTGHVDADAQFSAADWKLSAALTARTGTGTLTVTP